MTHPKEDVFGRVKARCIYSCCVWSAALTHDAASVAGDGALGRLSSLSVCAPLPLSSSATACCVSHHEVYHALCGTADLNTH